MRNYTSSRRKILLVAYLFPPIGGGGVQRALKMAKYVGEYNWDVHVLTVDPAYHVSLDESLLKQLPANVQIHRAPELRLWNRKPVVSTSTNATTSANDSATQTNPSTISTNRDSIAQPSATRRQSLIGRMKNSLKRTLKSVKNTILIPDDQILWYRSAVNEGLRLIEEHNIDVIFSTSGPYTNHLVGKKLKQQTNKVWIADFRDPWTQNMHQSHVWWRQKIEDTLERHVITQSDCLLTVTHSFASNFKRKYGNQIKQLEVIHNGYDRQDYIQLKQHPKTRNEKCTLIYTGIFYKERNPRLLLQAVAQLIEEKHIQRNKIMLQFAGVFDYPGNSENMDCVHEHELGDIVEVLGHVPHQTALQTMNTSDILLLVADTHPDSGDYIPGKLFEYMAIGHPILALSLPGESTHIIEKYELGEIADPQSLEQIKSALLKLYKQWESAGDAEGSLDRTDEPFQTPIDSQIIETDQQNEIQEKVQTENIERSDDEKLAKPPIPSALIYERKEQARMLAELMDELWLQHNKF